MFSTNNQKMIKQLKVGNNVLNLITVKSKKTNVIKYEKDNIYLFTQFYIPDNKERYDEIKETIFLARDRMGQKPLFYRVDKKLGF